MISIALLHYPVYNKNGDIITTCITGFDLHDIARTALTYGIDKYYVVNPAPAQLEFARRILNCWRSEQSYLHNWTRAEAFALVELRESLENVVSELNKPKIIATSAKPKGTISFSELRKRFNSENEDYLIVFGTGWGLAEEVMKKADFVLEPVVGPTAYNHLSVRSAAAIILDKLLGDGILCQTKR